MSLNAKPLAGLKVIELGTLIAGPFASRICAEFGAEVIKVESPDGGDPLCKWRKLYEGTSLWWFVQARNKQSLTLNLKHPDGLAILKHLLADADILIENFRPGVLEKLGLSWETLHALNPKLVMVRLSGFGQTGPMKDQPGFGAVQRVRGHPQPGQRRAQPRGGLGRKLIGQSGAGFRRAQLGHQCLHLVLGRQHQFQHQLVAGVARLAHRLVEPGEAGAKQMDGAEQVDRRVGVADHPERRIGILRHGRGLAPATAQHEQQAKQERADHAPPWIARDGGVNAATVDPPRTLRQSNLKISPIR